MEITSTSLRLKMSTAHFDARSVTVASNGSITMIVLSTGVRPFSQLASRVSTLSCLSQSTVDMFAVEDRSGWQLDFPKNVSVET